MLKLTLATVSSWRAASSLHTTQNSNKHRW